MIKPMVVDAEIFAEANVFNNTKNVGSAPYIVTDTTEMCLVLVQQHV